MKTLIPLLLLVIVTGCKEAKEAEIRFLSNSPSAIFHKDTRTVKAYCPDCGEEVSLLNNECKKCGRGIKWQESIKCYYCDGTGYCDVCKLFDKKGECRFCNGSGRLGSGDTCFNCNGTGKCHLCKGATKCDFCGGSGVYVIKGRN